MQYRPLGKSGIEASVVGLGTWAIGGWMWGGSDDRAAIRAIHAAVDQGMNLLDTAPIYGFGHSEEVVGKAIQGRRDKVVLATKCGLIWHAKKGDFSFKSDEKHPGADGQYHIYRYLAPENLRYEVEQSLKRLKTEVIDLYQTHWQETQTAREVTMGALLQLKDEGKIRAIGVSNATPEQIREYQRAGVVDSDQELYSMLDRKEEAAKLAFCAAENIAFLAYSPIAQGLLTGKIGPERTFEEGDQRRNKARFSVENRRKVAAMLADFQPIADRHRISLGQLAIAWTVQQPGCTHALVGARTPEQVAENAAAGDVRLTAEELATIRQAIVKHAADIP